jgi:hypothetical protein
LQYFIQNMTTVYKPTFDIVGDNSNDKFGNTLSSSADGTIVAVGAAVGNYVKIYKNTGTKWLQIGVTINGETINDESGHSVSLSADGTVVAIGAIQNTGVNGIGSGHVRVYKWTHGTDYNTHTTDIWTKIGVDIDGEAVGDESGQSVSLSADGTVVAIGAVLNRDGGARSGHVRVHKWTHGNDYTNHTTDIWTKIGVDIDGEANNDLSGNSVSLSADGTVVAIGARLNDGVNGNSSGHVRVYKWTHGTDYSNPTTDTWTKIGVDIDGEANNDLSGNSVSLSADGTVVAISSIYNDDNGSNAGHVRVFKWNHGIDYANLTTDLWAKIGDDIDGEADNDYSGTSVSLSADGTTVAISAINNDGNGNSYSGHVRVFKHYESNWNQNLLRDANFINVSGPGYVSVTGNGTIRVM